jgi:hypothetical protein
MQPDPILTDTNMLDSLLDKKGKLLLFYFPQEEITAIESATLATFLYTVMDVCGKYYLKKRIKYCIIVDDYGTWHHHKRSKQATEALIQRKGRKMGLLRALIAQTEDDLKESTIFDSTANKETTFDFRIDATINNAEIDGVQCMRGSVMFLHLRKHIHSRQGVKIYKPLMFVSRPPLSAYQLRSDTQPEEKK